MQGDYSNQNVVFDLKMNQDAVVVGDVGHRGFILIIYNRVPKLCGFNMMANNRELLENGSRIGDIRPGWHL